MRSTNDIPLPDTPVGECVGRLPELHAPRNVESGGVEGGSSFHGGIDRDAIYECANDGPLTIRREV